MGGFLSLLWPLADSAAALEAHALASRVDDGWRRVHDGPGAIVWVRGPRPPPLCAAASTLLIGVLRPRGAATPLKQPPGGRSDDLRVQAERLSADTWGAYLAIFLTCDGPAVFRDPSGGLEAFAWPLGATWLVTSEESPPPGLAPARMALDWDAIAAWFVDPGCAAIRPGFADLRIVPPGCLTVLRKDGDRLETIWRPSRIVTDDRDRCAPSSETTERLVDVVGLAVEGMAAPHARLIGELSGGLDSAIVAAALQSRGLCDRAVAWLNYYADRPEGDERPYAIPVAECLGLDLTTIHKPLAPLSEADFAPNARRLRPGFASLDPVRDRDTAQRLQALEATGLLTGQGGDVVFFQSPTPLLAADVVREGGWRALDVRTLGAIARFTRRSAWSVLDTAIRARHAPPAPFRRPGLATREVYDMILPPDPWSADAADLPPARRAQVTALFQSQLGTSLSARGAVAEVLEPLLSQPVVEFALGLSPLELTDGGLRDRALARRAHRGRLPDALLDRRSKGDLSAYYGLVVAASCDYLRPLLLDGALCDAGVLDRAKAAAALQPDQLILQPMNGEILIAAVIEHWVRWWQTRVPDAPWASRRG